MSGHSKWSTIKHKKGKADAQRGKMFTKLIREITVAARESGGDPDSNPRLRTAVATARAANMPADNIKKAIQKGTGELPGVSYDEVTYEAYGPGGVAMLIQVLTDNKNRAVAEIRHLLSRYNGNIGEAGCVSWMFTKYGFIQVESEGIDEDTIMMAALEAGASDVKNEGGTYDIYTDPGILEDVRDKVAAAGVTVDSAELAMIPQSTVKLDEKHAAQMMKLMEALEDHDDVQKVYANFDIDDELMEKLTAE
jgi:YebC/PmpR family DNA-binding regulatory protein